MDGVHEAAVGAQRDGSDQGLTKPRWTEAEDRILTEYVNMYGDDEVNWKAVQENSGLGKSNKSCRLRWINRLDPNLKKGPLSPEEKRLIIELQAIHGNKWSHIAYQLPGRTENDIKNYWYARRKRRPRAGSPVPPHGLQQEAPAADFHHHQLRHSSSSSALVFSSTSDHQNPNNNYSLQNHHHNSSSLYSNPMTEFWSSVLPNQSNIPNQTLIGQYNSHGGYGDNNLGPSSMVMGAPTYDPTPLVQGSNPELTSNQTLLSCNGGDEGQMGGSGYTANEYYYVPSQWNSGLSDDIFMFSSTSDHQNPNNNYSLQNHHDNFSSLYSNPMTQFHGNGGIAMPPFGSSVLPNQSNIPNQTLIGQYNSHGGFGDNNLGPSSMVMGAPTYDPTTLVQGSNPGLTSNQTPLSSNGSDEGQMGGSGYAANEYYHEPAPVPSQGWFFG